VAPLSAESERPFVYVIVLNWNGAAVIRECLDSLLAMDYPDFKVLVVDNASTDGSPEDVAGAYPQVELLRLDKNLLYAGGNNAGIERALEAGAGAVLLVNNDTVADSRLLTHLVEGLLGNPGAGVVGPKIFYYDKKDVLWSAGGKVVVPLGFVHHIGIRKPDSGRYCSEREVDYLTGCCLLMRSEALRAVGPLDPSYVIYSEDVDWCLRARGQSWSSVFIPEALLWHKVSHSSGGGLTPFKAYYKMRSNVLIFRRFARPIHWLLWPLATAGFALAMACVQAARGRPGLAREFLRGWGDGFFSPCAEGLAGIKKEPK
jgi:GT2 family glycosyltransferase